MANVNKIKAQGSIYDIEDTVARSSAVTITSKADGTVELRSSASTVTLPSLTNFGDPSELENDVVTEISDLKSDIETAQAVEIYAQGTSLVINSDLVNGNEVSF